MSADPDDYALSRRELDDIFDRAIAPTLFGTATRSRSPLLILIGAQPGAGKTRAGRDAAHESGQHVTRIIGDDLRRFHPAYRQLLTEHPSAMPDATAQASGAWVERSAAFAADHRISALVEGTFRNPAVPLGTATRFTDAGFHAEAHLVAVSPEISHLSIASRFVEDERAHGEARFTSLTAHDAAFDALTDTMRQLAITDSPIGRIVVRSRDGVVFDRTRTPGRSIRGALTHAKDEWDRTMEDLPYQRWTTAADDVTRYLKQRHAHDAGVRMLVKQIGYDRDYIDMVRSGAVAVRGHVRANSDIPPHTRSWPTS